MSEKNTKEFSYTDEDVEVLSKALFEALSKVDNLRGIDWLYYNIKSPVVTVTGERSCE